MELTEGQRRTAEAVLSNPRNVLVAAETGAGKTVWAAHVMEKLAERHSWCAVVWVCGRTLHEQTRSTVARTCAGLDPVTLRRKVPGTWTRAGPNRLKGRGGHVSPGDWLWVGQDRKNPRKVCRLRVQTTEEDAEDSAASGAGGWQTVQFDAGYLVGEGAAWHLWQDDTFLFTTPQSCWHVPQLPDNGEPYGVVVDECHVAANRGSDVYRDLERLCHGADRVVLMSATPCRNGPKDLVAPLALMGLSEAARCVENALEGSEAQVVRDAVPPGSVVSFAVEGRRPQLCRTFRTVEDVSEEGLRAVEAQGRRAFLVPGRRAGDALKIPLLLDLLRERLRSVVYCAFVARGVHVVAEAVRRELPSHRVLVLTGEVHDRPAVLAEYNRGRGATVLVMGPVGGQGVDLKETDQLVGLSHHWNEAAMAQVEGRVSRHGSHAQPEIARVRSVFLQIPGDTLPDARMRERAAEKQVLIGPTMAALLGKQV